MADLTPDPRTASVSELASRAGGPRVGAAYLAYRDGSGHLHVTALEESSKRVVLGRGPAADVWLAWDEQVSRVHAQLERIGDDWLLVDDGLSANGTLLNAEPVDGRRRLRDGDVIGIGSTELVYRAPMEGDGSATVIVTPPTQP
jgi:pSer/pThr/pTyr-binding forkhead associated (FHA) protein